MTGHPAALPADFHTQCFRAVEGAVLRALADLTPCPLTARFTMPIKNQRRTITCNNCGGTGVTYPDMWGGRHAPPPSECPCCNGSGEREVRPVFGADHGTLLPDRASIIRKLRKHANG